MMNNNNKILSQSTEMVIDYGGWIFDVKKQDYEYSLILNHLLIIMKDTTTSLFNVNRLIKFDWRPLWWRPLLYFESAYAYRSIE